MDYLFKEKVFEHQFCEKIITHSNQLGFKQALVNIYGVLQEQKNIRNNLKVEFVDTALANTIEEKIKNLDFSINMQKFVRASPQFKVYLYEENNYFKPHKDGFIKELGEQSLVTCLIYLNDTAGGETVLMPNGFADKPTHVTIVPTSGSILLFKHDMWHEGKPVLSGQKYVLRTNLFYKEH